VGPRGRQHGQKRHKMIQMSQILRIAAKGLREGSEDGREDAVEAVALLPLEK